MMPFGFYPMGGLDLVLMILPMLLALWAQFKVKGAYAKYSQIGSRSGMTGAYVARRIMDTEGINDVDLEPIAGEMTDHYDPIHKVVRLSEGVYNSTSLAALGIAAHEVGHVIQDARGYAPMRLRHAIYPVANIGSKLAWPLIIAGLIFGLGGGIVLKIGIYLFIASVAFTVITLPVEFNASRRAMLALAQGGTMPADELAGAKKVLDAAALTYVAAAAGAILTLIRLLLIAQNRD